MSSFKEVAYDILKEAGKSLHSVEITKIAIKKGWLKTAGKTPEATMNAQLVVDINIKGNKSRFIKTGPSIFGINRSLKKFKIIPEKRFLISQNVSSKQKGDIAEARIAELITLYGDTTLSCYKPISDDNGLDLIVKEKNSLKTMYIQIKSRFGNNLNEIFTAAVKSKNMENNYAVGIIFCYFDIEAGDLWNYLWFVPAPDFIDKCNKLKNGKTYGFVAGRKRKDTNKWDSYLIDKRDLANIIISKMKKI